MNFNEKLISLRKSKGLSQEELGARLVLLSDYFGLTLDELIKDIDVQEVREKNINEDRLNSIYNDTENAKKVIKWGIIIGGGIAAILLISVIILIITFV